MRAPRGGQIKASTKARARQGLATVLGFAFCSLSGGWIAGVIVPPGPARFKLIKLRH